MKVSPEVNVLSLAELWPGLVFQTHLDGVIATCVSLAPGPGEKASFLHLDGNENRTPGGADKIPAIVVPNPYVPAGLAVVYSNVTIAFDPASLTYHPSLPTALAGHLVLEGQRAFVAYGVPSFACAIDLGTGERAFPERGVYVATRWWIDAPLSGEKIFKLYEFSAQ